MKSRLQFALCYDCSTFSKVVRSIKSLGRVPQAEEARVLRCRSLSAIVFANRLTSPEQTMRLILCNSHLSIAKPPQLPDDIIVFTFCEDLTVGPLEDWHNQVNFLKNRSDFWRKTSALDLPDGSKMDHFFWKQTLPRYDLAKLLKSGVAFEDIPDTFEFNELAPTATNIEIWCDQTANGRSFLWYLSAALESMGVNLSCVSLCIFKDMTVEKRSQKFWSDMLLDKTTRDIPARRPTHSEWEKMAQYWRAVTEFPKPVEPAVMQNADQEVLKTFDTLMSRHPDPETGLTNLQVRLLCAATKDWLRMARVVTDAMFSIYDETDYVGELVLQAELEEMARMQPPLIEIKGTGSMRFCEVRLTTHGESKLI